jgi:hypothetical protein
MDICCGRANCDSIEYILKMDNYEIIWKMDDEDWDWQSHGSAPQFHIKHNGRIYKIQYASHELFKVIYDFDPAEYGDYEAMSQTVIKVMSEYENCPIHFAYKEGSWRVWAGGCHLSYSDIELYTKAYVLNIDLAIKRCHEEYNKIKQH